MSISEYIGCKNKIFINDICSLRDLTAIWLTSRSLKKLQHGTLKALLLKIHRQSVVAPV